MSELLKYKREGYSQTRDALVWVCTYAPDFKFGLTLADVLAGLEHGYASVRPQLQDEARIRQWEQSLSAMREAFAMLSQSKVHEGKVKLQEAEELFVGIRHIGGKAVSRQRLGETEHGANELDE
jgi:hypothetical protein